MLADKPLETPSDAEAEQEVPLQQEQGFDAEDLLRQHAVHVPPPVLLCDVAGDCCTAVTRTDTQGKFMSLWRTVGTESFQFSLRHPLSICSLLWRQQINAQSAVSQNHFSLLVRKQR
eukprot:6405572-Amphidinium_carterae.1